jgi:hypothetical protein
MGRAALAQYEIAVWDNPRRPGEGMFTYLERIAVLAGGMEPGTGFLKRDHQWSDMPAAAGEEG